MYIIDNYIILEQTGYMFIIEAEVFNTEIEIVNPAILN